MSEESEKRRRRTVGYLGLWRVEAALDAVPVPVADDVVIRSSAEVCAHAVALCLLALKGQGLSQLEAFAFADAYGAWEALDAEETDFILDLEPSGDAVLQYAWRYEGLYALEWALGLGRHLVFPVEPVDPARALEVCIERIATKSGDELPTLRTAKEILDAVDVARCLEAIAASARSQALPPPGGIHPGVVYERDVALRWLIGQ